MIRQLFGWSRNIEILVICSRLFDGVAKYKSRTNIVSPAAPIGIMPISTWLLDSFSHAREPIPIPIAKVANNNVVINSLPLIILSVYAGIWSVIADA